MTHPAVAVTNAPAPGYLDTSPDGPVLRALLTDVLLQDSERQAIRRVIDAHDVAQHTIRVADRIIADLRDQVRAADEIAARLRTDLLNA